MLRLNSIIIRSNALRSLTGLTTTTHRRQSSTRIFQDFWSLERSQLQSLGVGSLYGVSWRGFAGEAERGPVDLLDLTAKDTPAMYELSGVKERQLVPEGCKAVTDHFMKSKSRQLMLRSAFFRLLDKVAPVDVPAGERRIERGTQLYLQGGRGSGKSVMLSQVVQWARAQGWLVLYVPNAEYYLSNSNFSKHSSGMFDTPESACDLLKSLHLAHADLLAGIELKSGGTLGQLVEEGASFTSHGTDQPQVMDIALQVLDILHSRDLGVPVLIAIDNFNYFFAGSDFHEWTGIHKRTVVEAGNLRLVRKLREVAANTGKPGISASVVATSASTSVSPKVQMPGVPFHSRQKLAFFDIEETATFVEHLRECGVSRYGIEDRADLARLQFLSGGDALQLRLISCVV